MRLVVYGAGAVGSVLGGLLAQRQHDVLLVCRPAHAAAIRDGGLRLRSGTGDYVARPAVTETLAASDITDDSMILLTTKSHATRDSTREMARVASRATPVVVFQNGVGNEDVVAEHFENVHGGICRMTCSMLQPGHASFRKIGRVIVGRYPKGADAAIKQLCSAFEEAGFDASVSRNICADRWLKLAVNTQSVFHAVIDPRDHDANEFFELKALILEETKKIYKAAKIRAKSCDGRDPSIDEMIDDLRRPRARRQSHGMKVHNSTWQDLYLRRPALESPLFHEVILSLAREHGVSAPYHEAALAVLRDAHGSGSGPDTLRLAEVLDAVDERKGAS